MRARNLFFEEGKMINPYSVFDNDPHWSTISWFILWLLCFMAAMTLGLQNHSLKAENTQYKKALIEHNLGRYDQLDSGPKFVLVPQSEKKD